MTPVLAAKKPRPSKLAKLSKMQPGESSRALTQKTFVERATKAGFKRSAEKWSCASVLQKISVGTVQRSRRQRTRKTILGRANIP